MKKFLFWVFSIVLTASAAAPASAQLLAKKGGEKARVAAAATLKAPEKGKEMLSFGQKRSSKFNAVPGQLQNIRTVVTPKNETPAYEGAALPELRGSVIYMDGWSDSYAPVGLYSLPKNADGTFTELIPDVDASRGGVEVDGIYYATTYTSFWGMVFIDVYAYDLETGEVVGQWSPEDFAVIGIDYTYDPATGKVYGITYNSAGNGLQLSEIEFGTDINVTAIGALDGNWNSIAADKDGILYGIKFEGTGSGESFVATGSELVKFDKTNGSYEVIGATGQAPQYMTSSTIDPISNRMFWTVCSPAEDGYLCEVNTTTGVATKLFELENNAEVVGLYVQAPLAEPKAPAAVTNLSASFPDGKLVGSLTFDVPSTLYDGTPATGYVKYKVTANGDLVDLASVEYGTTVTVEPVTVYETGMVNFVVVLTNEVGDSPKAKTSCFVGNGVPNAPKNVKAEYTGTQMNISWNAVTASADGGYVNPDEVTYTVVGYPGKVQVAKDIKALSVSQVLTAPEDFTIYYYEVTAKFAGSTSVAGVSNNVFLGSLNPPYEVTFNSAASLDPFTIIDANNDGKTWQYSNGLVRVAYNSREAMDDWLISAPIKLKAGYAYYVSIDASAYSSTFNPESFEIMAGTAPTVEAMTETVIPATDLTLTTRQSFGKYFVAPADGNYNFGIHGISPADKFYLQVYSFGVSAGVPATAPAAGQITATADPSGAYNVAVNMTTPGLDIAGDPVGALTKAELYRGETLIKTFNAPRASAALSFNDVLDNFGTVSYTFVSYTASGKGESVSTSVFVGTDKPAAPQNVYLQETDIPGYLTLSWDAVNTAANGSAINPDRVSYNVYNITDDGYLGDLIAGDLHITAYTFEAFDPEADQKFVQYALEAVTEGGNQIVASDMIPVGKAYDGMFESFPGPSLSYLLGISTGGGASFNIATDSSFTDLTTSDGDNGMLVCQTQYQNYYGSFFTGKVSMEGFENPVFSFYTVPISDQNTNTILVEAREMTGNYETVTELVMNQIGSDMEWTKVTIPMTQYKDKTIQVRVTITCHAYTVTVFDQLFLGNQLNNDLVATNISAPERVAPGTDFNVNVKINNEGAKVANNFKVEFYKNGEVEEVKNVETLASGASTTLTFPQTMSGAAVESVSYKAVVVYDADENEENNETALIAVDPILSTLPGVKNLSAEGAQKGNILKWEEPDLTIVQSSSEDFESATAFAQNMEGWTFYDGDGSPVGGFQNSDIPGITPGSTTASFFVFDNDVFGGNQTFEAHSGSKYLASLFRYDDGQVDDWAISPELSGDAQTISFWAKSYSGSYPESVEVLYSTTGTDTDDFTAISGAKWTGLSDEWTEYTAALPAGAKYFAIRSFATGAFMLMIDDVTFDRAGGNEIELTIYGYEVYRDGVKISGDALVEECKFLDTDVEHGVKYDYAVVPVFDLGVGMPMFADAWSGINDVEAGIVITTADKNVVVLNAEGVEVIVSAVDGKVLFAGEGTAKTVVPASTGVYVVKAGVKVAKVVVK